MRRTTVNANAAAAAALQSLPVSVFTPVYARVLFVAFSCELSAINNNNSDDDSLELDLEKRETFCCKHPQQQHE